jgi:serine/threonine-protein kinase
MSVPSSRRFKTGDTIGGRYRLETPLGAGGFGAVYRARQVSSGGGGVWGATDGLFVALKLLHPDVLSSDDGRERFRREALLAQRLLHPNVVRLHDFGEAEGVPFIAFEILHGKSLDVVLREERVLAHPRVLRITLQVLKALMAAHAAGIVHRDIKPANVFLCDFQGEPDFVKVLDFGIAKAVGATSLAEMTRTGQIVGTPAYMSPEMLRENAASPAADVYALGLTMIRMISGELAYKGTPAEVIHGQLSHGPVPLPALAVQSPLAPVIRRAVEKNPSLRYANAAEMLGDVQRTSSAGASFAAASMSFALPSSDAAPTAQPFAAPSGPSSPAIASTPTRPATPAPLAPPPQTSVIVAPTPSPSHPQLPSHPSHPSMPSMPSASAATKRASSPARLVLLGVGLTLVAAVIGVGVAAYALNAKDAPPKTSPTTAAKHAAADDAIKDDPDLDPPPPKKNPLNKEPTADARVVRKRLEEDGWQITGTPYSDPTSVVDQAELEAVKKKDDLGVVVTVLGTVEEANQWFSGMNDNPTTHNVYRLGRRTIISVQCDTLSQSQLVDLAKRLSAPP